MGIFDYFKKKHNQEELVDNEIATQSSSTSSPTTQPTNIYDGIYADGELLKKVYPQNIHNGIFIVPEYIKSINMFAFSNLQSLHTVVMHAGVRYIAPFAFQGCNNLREIKGLESSETMVVANGYQYCYNLENITLPPNITTIGEGAFKDCTKLTSIKIPDDCWFISKYAFAGCEGVQTIQIPASVELIDHEAFAGCKNLTITFLDDDKRYLQDVIKEQEAIEAQYRLENFDDIDLDENDNTDEAKASMTDEEKKALYDDMGIKYRQVNIGGQEILWTSGKLRIKSNALNGVKEIIAYNQDTIETIMQSGYKGKVTLVDRDKKEAITIDIPAMMDYKKGLITKARERYYQQTLIPSGGTLNWMINCEKHNYKCGGYTNDIVCDIPIASDSHIAVTDHLQIISVSKYTKEYEEFFTSVTFYKKELDNHSVYAPHEYERSYCIYYPYGARFDEDMLLQIGSSLNGLIDKARDLPDTTESQEELKQIRLAQKKLIDLFLNGTTDRNIVAEILKDITLPNSSGKIREARHKKDWLPYYNDPLFGDFKELDEYRESKHKNENSL